MSFRACHQVWPQSLFHQPCHARPKNRLGVSSGLATILIPSALPRPTQKKLASPLVQLDGQVVGVLKENKALSGQLVEANRFGRDLVAVKMLNGRV